MIEDILLFIKVVQAGSIFAVEKKLGIPRSTISRRLDQLEEKTGKTLLVRSLHGIELTEAGRQMYNSFETLESQLNQKLSNIEEKITEGNRRINLVLPLTFSNAFFLPRVGQLLDENKNMELNIIHNFTGFNMKKELYDIAVVTYEPAQQAQKFRKIGKDKEILVCTPEYITKHGLWEEPENFNGHIIVGRQTPDGVISTKAVFFPEDNQPQKQIPNPTKLILSSWLEAKTVVLAHQAISGLPLSLVKDELATGKLVRLFPDYHLGEFYYYLIRNIDEDDTRYQVILRSLTKVLKELNGEE